VVRPRRRLSAAPTADFAHRRPQRRARPAGALPVRHSPAVLGRAMRCVTTRTLRRQTAASTAPMPAARPRRRGQAPQPRSGCAEGAGLDGGDRGRSTIKRAVHHSADTKLHRCHGPERRFDYLANLHHLTDVTPEHGASIARSGQVATRQHQRQEFHPAPSIISNRWCLINFTPLMTVGGG
jgi:hypothetical protein